MKNRDVFAQDPATNRPLNNGVATVNDSDSEEEQRTLRYELQSFVCDGQYAKGLDRVLDAFLSNQSQTSQPGIWISGFFGSGKSHLVKVFRALWTDIKFDKDKTTARGLVKVPKAIRDHLVELDRLAKKGGGTHACSGTLGNGVGDNVRMALLAMVFKSVGLSAQFPFAQFELWLKEEGYYEPIRKAVEKAGKEWQSEVLKMYVSPIISDALLKVYPDFATSGGEARKLIKETYPNVQDVTIDQMVDAIRDALTPKGGKFPLTLIALDEVQQYIGENTNRTYAIQEVTEACCKRFGPKLLFIGTGQTALSGTPNLQKLKDRFPLAIELSDNDVDEVIRKLILAKKAAALPELQEILDENSGEIARHLKGTKLEQSPDDADNLTADYPVLPVRRRFWERTLRAVDQGGTTGQLRNQIKVVHEAVAQTANQPLGQVVAGDFIFEQISTNLLQSGVLPREIFEYTEKLRAGNAINVLKARLCSLIFLIGKLPQEAPADLGVRATAETLADLLVTDLKAGSAELRKQIPPLLKQLSDEGKIMQVGAEWRTQTKESGAWNEEYLQQRGKLLAKPQVMEQERVQLMRGEIAERLGKFKVLQGKSKALRKPEIITGIEPPKTLHQQLSVWLRDGWTEDGKGVLSEVQAAGTKSPAVYVFVPQHEEEELRQQIATWKAASATLNFKGVPSTPEGLEARRAMEGRAKDAGGRVNLILAEVFSRAIVYQAGGAVVDNGDLASSIEAAVESALVRLYPRFDDADHDSWDKVIDRARKGSESALEAVGYKGNVDKHPVTRAVLAFVVAGKTGGEVRTHFDAPEFGWSKDAIDGGLYALLAAGQIKAVEAGGKEVDAKALDRAKIGQAIFRPVSGRPVTIQERIHIRKVLQEAKVAFTNGEELAAIPALLERLKELAARAGGYAPLPAQPPVVKVDELEKLSGNDLMFGIYDHRDELTAQMKLWRGIAEKIHQRLPAWEELLELLQQGPQVPTLAPYKTEADAILSGRLLIAQPDLVPALLAHVTQALRTAMIAAHDAYTAEHATGLARLAGDANWAKLSASQRETILQDNGLATIPSISTGTSHDVLASLKSLPLSSWADRTAALPSRFERALRAASKLLEPTARYFKLPTATLKSPADVQAWLEATQKAVLDQLAESDGVLVVH